MPLVTLDISDNKYMFTVWSWIALADAMHKIATFTTLICPPVDEQFVVLRPAPRRVEMRIKPTV